jgi:hypothetical protein
MHTTLRKNFIAKEDMRSLEFYINYNKRKRKIEVRRKRVGESNQQKQQAKQGGNKRALP